MQSASGANSLPQEGTHNGGASGGACLQNLRLGFTSPTESLKWRISTSPIGFRDFIVKHIDSVAQIEALLLVRSNPQERWNVSQIAARLYASETEVAEALDRLCAAGLLIRDNDIYRFEGISPENAALIHDLLTIYARHLIAVTNIIHAKPRRIRSFADAFRFRKDP